MQQTYSNEREDFVYMETGEERSVEEGEGYRRRYCVVQVAATYQFPALKAGEVNLHQSIIKAHCFSLRYRMEWAQALKAWYRDQVLGLIQTMIATMSDIGY